MLVTRPSSRRIDGLLGADSEAYPDLQRRIKGIGKRRAA
jgi:hypothetical protein